MRSRGVFLSAFLEKPARGCAAASRNNIHTVPGNGSKLAQFTPEQPQRTQSHGCDHHRCLLWGSLDVLGALLKVWKNLLRLAAAQPLAGPLTLFEDAAACRKMGFKKSSRTPQLNEWIRCLIDGKGVSFLGFCV